MSLLSQKIGEAELLRYRGSLDPPFLSSESLDRLLCLLGLFQSLLERPPDRPAEGVRIDAQRTVTYFALLGIFLILLFFLFDELLLIDKGALLTGRCLDSMKASPKLTSRRCTRRSWQNSTSPRRP